MTNRFHRRQARGSLRPSTYTAQVTAVRLVECEIPQDQACRRVEARLLQGPDTGDTSSFPLGVTLSDPEFSPGDRVRLAGAGPEATLQGLDAYSFSDYERRAPMLWLLAAFAVVVVVFGRRRGLLSLVALGASIAVITLFLVPMSARLFRPC